MDFIARKIDGELYVSMDQVNKAIEEKNAEIARLEADNDRLEVLRRTHVEAIVSMSGQIIPNQAKEIRGLKCALWLARGYIMTLLHRDFQRLAYQCNSDDYKNNLIRRRNKFYDLYEKCIKKAGEYK